MNRTIQPRRADTHDVSTIAQHRFPNETGPHVEAYAAWLPDAMACGQYLGWVVEGDGGIIAGAGLMLLHWGPTREDPQPWRGRLVNVYTHPDHRRQGMAHALVGEALRAAHARGIRTVTLGTTVAARPLYESLGFRAVSTELLWRAP